MDDTPHADTVRYHCERCGTTISMTFQTVATVEPKPWQCCGIWHLPQYDGKPE